MERQGYVYGVLNNVAEKALKDLGLWPQDIKNATEAEVYEVVNQLLLRLASELGTDLWTLDYLWWYLAQNVPPTKDDPFKKVTPAVDSSFKSANQLGPRPTTPPSSAPRPSRLAQLDPLSVLGRGGRISALLSGYEMRDEQLRMAKAVAGAIESRTHLMVEAGTGVRKSFAYLVPAILAATELGKRSSCQRGRSIFRTN